MNAFDLLLLCLGLGAWWWWRQVQERVAETGNGSRLSRLLASAGWNLPPAVYLVLLGLLALAVAGVVFRLFNGLLAAAFVAFVMTIYTGHSLVQAYAVQRTSRFEEKLISAVDLMISALRAGENPLQALRNAGEVSRDPVRREFLEVVRRLQLGMPIDRALQRMARGYDSEGVRLLCSTLIAKWSAGGDLTPVLTSVGKVMRERLQYRLHLKGQLAGAQVSSLVVAASPYLLLVIYAWRKPDWLHVLLTHPLGSALLFTAICLQVIGFLWIQRIMRTDL